MSVEGGVLNGFLKPAAQTVTLDSDKSVTLEYKASTPAGTLVSDTAVSGRVVGTDLQIDSANPAYFRDPFSGIFKLKDNVLNIDLSDFVPDPRSLYQEFRNSNCTGNVSNPLALSRSNYGFLAFSAQGDMLGYLEEAVISGPDATLPDPLIYRTYADRVFNFKGTCTFQAGDGTTYTENYDISLVKGWNTLVAGRGSNSATVRNAAPGNRVELRFEPLKPSVFVSLDTSPLEFRTNDTVTVNARLIQIGDYSGTVTLSTDLPGLTVEPSSVTLKPLPRTSAQGVSGQNVQPQSLSTKLTFRYAGAQRQLYNQFVQVLVKTPAGQQVGDGSVFVTINKPEFGIFTSLPTERLSVFAGEQSVVPVGTTSMTGFTDPITVTLENAPAGITATPTTGQVNTQINLPLTVAANVVPGSYDVTLVGTSGSQVRRTTLKLQVQPRRVALGQVAVTFMTLAPNGDLWGAQGSRVIQIRGEQVVGTHELPASATAKRIQTGPDGSIWVATVEGQLYRKGADQAQKFSSVTARIFSPGVPFGIDRQGRAWVMAFDGFNVPALHRINPSTNEDTVIATVKPANSAVPVANDSVGENIVFPAADGTLVKVNTTAGTSVASAAALLSSEEMGNQVSVLSIAQDRQGKLWGTVGGYRTISFRQIDLQNLTFSPAVTFGEVSFSSYSQVQSVVENAQTAWLAEGGALHQFNLGDRTRKTVFLGSDDVINFLSIAPKVGIAYGFKSRYDTTGQQYLVYSR
ncbi:hypothetical protein [Deinococcus frigens]|uniref:hypothetical protein n=1 Tax=Deinococcus frigens TaxID=249403 RepID=UPI0012EBB906|nr:hypothetical protein [Deinococcus frigens]